MQAANWVRNLIDDEIATVSRLRSSRHTDFPHSIHLETFAVCNAACGFCPYPDLDRKGARMPDSLIEKIVDELAEIPASLPFNLMPFKVNEPFLDKRLPDILETFNDRVPNAAISLFSNGSAFTEANLTRIAPIQNICQFVISLNEYEPDAYFELMKIPLARTLDRLRMLHDRVVSGAIRHPITVNRVMDGSATDNRFLEWGREAFPAFQVTISQRKDWNGQVEERTAFQTAPKLPCRRWFDLSIMATGSTTMCCMDGKGEWPIGDVNDQHLLDIYNEPKHKSIRLTAANRHDVAACRTCTYL